VDCDGFEPTTSASSLSSVRMFSPEPVPRELIEIAVRSANTAPRPYIFFPVGYLAEDCTVPDLERKELSKILKIYYL
jgi:hypothetical protein